MLDFYNDQVRLTIADDGAGFEPSSGPSERAHFGLVGMRERAAKIGGQLKLRTVPKNGTTITVTVPNTGPANFHPSPLP